MANTISLIAPVKGEVVGLEVVPDPVFSEKMMGDGFAIKPTKDVVVAPCDGKILSVFPTKHAIGLVTKEGLEILIHIGLDTVNLNGKGFKSYVVDGEEVKQGQNLISFDYKYVMKKAKSLITPVVITNMDRVNNLMLKKGEVVSDNEIVMNVEVK